MELFKSVTIPDKLRSQFSANHDILSSANIGAIVPLEAIEYYPGDKFNLDYSHEVNFPPLQSPTYQRFKLKQYLFKVRSGLAWDNESLANDIRSMSDGSSHVSPPMFELDINDLKGKQYWHGTYFQGFGFNPQLPCNAIVRNNIIYWKKPVSGEISVNAWLYGLLNGSLTDIERATYTTIAANAFRYVKYRDNDFKTRRWFYQHDPQLATSTVKDTFGQHAPYTPTSLSNSITANYETFYKANKTSETWTLRYIVPPMAMSGELLDQLGYPKMRYDDDRDRETWKAAYDMFVESYRDVQSTTLPEFGLNIYGNMYADEGTNFADQVKDYGSGTYVGMTLIQLLQMYIEYCVMIGKADGSALTEDQVPIFAGNMDYEYYAKFNHQNTDLNRVSALRFNSFWLIYNNYFLEPSVQREMAIDNVYGNYIDPYDSRTGYKHYQNETTDEFNNVFSTGTLQKFDWLRSAYNYFRLPQKLLDRDYFSNLLPTTSIIKVAAPCTAALGNDEVSIDKSQIPDYSPSTTISASAFMSLDSLRTASYLQKFFETAYLAGNQPVQQILAIYGAHSQDFRHEIPVLLQADEVDVSPTEITQQSETEQLPLGTEGGKLTIFSQNRQHDFIDSDGDFGIIIPIVCIYPVQDTIFGLDPHLLCSNAYQMRFIPDFSTLGEEEVHCFQYDFQPKSILTGGTNNADSTLGYIPRYGFYKFLPSQIHGRFNSDFSHWKGQPLPSANSAYPSLGYEFLKTPDCRNLFVTQENQMCKIHSVCFGDFIRTIADVPILGVH